MLTAMFLLWAAVVTGSCWYLFSGYQALVRWYLGLNDCFYRCQTWSTDFFTPGIKSDGNMYCIIAMAIASAGLVYVFRREQPTKKSATPLVIQIGGLPDIALSASLLIIAAVLWAMGNKATLPALDEVFSAYNSAGIHPFQAVSYYMLPNNHVFFNFLNDVFFHSFPDKVATGRAISLVAYCMVIISVFAWFRKILANSWLAFLVAIAISLQCPVWGFGFQARGYELYLLAEWGLLISLFSYLAAGNKRWLYINVICCCIGYFCMPSFLYMHATQLVFMLVYMSVYRSKDTAFWISQLAAVGITYLLYLPLLCFSGLAALVSNSYVAPMKGFQQKGLGEFLQWTSSIFRNDIEHIFSNVHWGAFSFDLALFCLPLTLLLKRNHKTSRLLGLFYISMWIVFFLMVVVMKRMPFERNLIGHYSFTLAAVSIVAAWLAGAWSQKENARIAGSIAFAAMMVLLSFHFYFTNDSFKKITLYEHDVNEAYKHFTEGLRDIPAGCTVAFSDEGFFARYYCEKKGCTVTACATGNETYYVKEFYEPMPLFLTARYDSVTTAGENVIYKRK